jgi:hypothetical protein
MSREIFRKVPISEKKSLFREAVFQKFPFYLKGEDEELITAVADEFIEGRALVFSYAAGSFEIKNPQKVVFNFSFGEDRYFFQALAEVYGKRIHISSETDVYVLQRRKSPRLEIPKDYPGTINIIDYGGKPTLLKCQLLDFSTGGARVLYDKHLPEFKNLDQFTVVVHLNHRRPFELQAEIRHTVADYLNATQAIGLRFKLESTLLENKLLVVFMDLQRELFVKWSGSS